VRNDGSAGSRGEGRPGLRRVGTPAGRRRPASRALRSWSRGLWLFLGLGLVDGLALLACNDGDDGFFGDAPDAPRNLISFTGDEEVILVWDAVAGDVESYNVYALIVETGDFEVIGITTSSAFLDNDVVNGETYRYRVTAVDFDGDESDFSEETFDTPRPDEFNVLLASVQTDAANAGFDLTTGQVVSATSSAATFRFEEAGGVPRIQPMNGAEVQNVGFVDLLGEVNFAPESGYFPEPMQAFVGDAYVFRIPQGGSRFFGVVRISHVAPGVLVFDWAFQTDEGNRELLRRLAPPRD
jgi:hypothetical protein